MESNQAQRPVQRNRPSMHLLIMQAANSREAVRDVMASNNNLSRTTHLCLIVYDCRVAGNHPAAQTRECTLQGKASRFVRQAEAVAKEDDGPAILLLTMRLV